MIVVGVFQLKIFYGSMRELFFSNYLITMAAQFLKLVI